MTTTSAPSDPRRRRHGFTLTEVIVATAVSALVLAGVCATFIAAARGGMRIGSYNRMLQESRTALDLVARDIRTASDISWASGEKPENEFRLTRPHQPTVRYRLSGGQLLVQEGTAAERVLVRNVVEGKVRYYRIDGSEIIPDPSRTPSVNPLEVKLVRVELLARAQVATTADTSNYLISASFILRNKKVTS
jgi:prepilin-type N-terminal cleavage/methylation domain-containing protein